MTGIQEFTRTPCPICGHTGWCGSREDGLILCKRPPEPPGVGGYVYRGRAQDGQTALYVESVKEHRAVGAPRAKPSEGGPPSAAVTATIQEAHAEAVRALTPERRAALAAELGLPDASLDALAIGWSDVARHHVAHDVKGAWILPECDGQGRLIGVTFRFPSQSVADKTGANGKPLGNKSAPSGLRRGLTLPVGWKEMTDPVLVVEGAGDVLAGRAVGLSVIGRPSNTGGVEYLAQVCQRRRVIVLGDNDRKPDGRWPGREGAERVARKLEVAWGRPVPVALPPEGTKDLRDWVRHLAPDWAAASLAAARETILAAVQPPALLLLAQPVAGRGRVVLKVFRWADGVEAPAIHSDRLHLEDAAARKRFARAVASAAPETDTDDLVRRMLALKVPAGRPAKPPSSPAPSAPGTDGPAPETPPATNNSLPEVFLPGGPVPITQSAAILGSLMARTDKYYLRGGVVVTLGKDDDGLPILEVLKPAALASVFETVAQLMKHYKEKTGFVPHKSVCCEQDAKLVQHCAAFQQLLPPIRLLSRCPVLIERDGQLVQVCGYDRASAIMAFGDRAPEVPLEEAMMVLLDAISDFQFATAADRARALASIVTPALVFGRLLGGRAPVDLSEADASQAGKGFKNKITAAIYKHIVKTVTQKKGGVGSLEESFATALVRGYNFISLDNVRNAIDSPAIESFLTEDSFLARAPHLAAVEVDPRRVIVQLTSNKADITIDLANRSSCVRILKQPEGYRFREYPEGSILEHIRANQPQYLGAVFAIIRAWHQAGMPQTAEARHAFRPWAQTLDWIVQHIFRAGPLLDGHREAQVRMATPVMNWLRDVALAVRSRGHPDLWLRASDLVDILSESPGLEIPGLPEGGDLASEDVRKRVLQAVGRRMALCFGEQSTVSLDGITVMRRKTEDAMARPVRDYQFTVETGPSDSLPYAPESHRGRIGETVTREADSAPQEDVDEVSEEPAEPLGVTDTVSAPLSFPYAPLSGSAMKPQCSPVSAMGSVIAPREDQNMDERQEVCELFPGGKKEIGTLRGIGEMAETPAPQPDEDEVLL